MKHLLILLLSAANLLMSAQLSTVQKRLRAVTIKDYLLLRYEPVLQTMSYETDPRRVNRSRQHTLNKDKANEFTAASDKINFDLSFINPLKYDVSVIIKYREDEIYKNIGKFTESLSMVLNTATDLQVKLNTDPKSKARNDATMDVLKMDNDFKKSELLSYSSSWYAWYFQLAQLKGTILADGHLADFVKSVVSNSGKIYDTLNDNAGSKKIAKVLASYSNLKSADTYNKLKEISDQLKKSCSDHQDILDDATKWCKDFKDILNTNLAFDTKVTINGVETYTPITLANIDNLLADTASASSDKKKKDAKKTNMPDQTTVKVSITPEANAELKNKTMFYNYSVIVSNEFINQVSDEIQSEKKIIENITAILAEIDKIQYDPELGGAIILQEISIDPAMTTNVVVQIALRDGDDKSKSSCEINISENSSVIPEFAVGAAFTNITFPIYGLAPAAPGSFSITQGSDGISNYSFLAMLNLLPKFQSTYYPVFQLGGGLAGSSKTIPVMGVGAGLRIFQPTALSITFGALWHWQRVLSNLNPGDFVTSSDVLDKNLHYNFITKPVFYLGVQYSF